MFEKIKTFFRPGRIERKSNTNTIPIKTGSFLDFALRDHGVVNANQAMEFYQDNSSIATAVDLIAESIEQITPVLQDKEGNFIDDSEVINLLKNPNGFETWKEFSGALARHYLLTHDSHIFASGNISLPPTELFAVKPQMVSVIEDITDSYPKSYLIPRSAGHGNYVRNENILGINRFYDGPFKELYHIMGFSSRNNNIRGDSPLNAAALEAKQQIRSKVHNLQVINNGGRLSLIIAFQDESIDDDDEHKRRKDRIIESLTGPDNAGGVAVISAPKVDIKEASQTNKDMDFAKLDEISSQAIYLRYHIPLPLVTIKASTFNNMEKAILQLYDQAVIPPLNIIFSGLSKMLLPRFNIDPNMFKISFDPDSITALMTRRIEELGKRVTLKIETTNELRGLLPGRDDIEGGDVIYQPVNQVPLGFEQIKDEVIL